VPFLETGTYCFRKGTENVGLSFTTVVSAETFSLIGSEEDDHPKKEAQPAVATGAEELKMVTPIINEIGAMLQKIGRDM
jgi:hypothetical protein